MKLAELFDLREKVETRVNQYWTYWSVSIFAICGWMFSGSSKGLDSFSYILISFGLLFFFLANLSVLKTSTELVMSVKDEIALKAPGAKFLSKRLNETLARDDIKHRLKLTIALHLAVDVVLLTALIERVFS